MNPTDLQSVKPCFSIHPIQWILTSIIVLFSALSNAQVSINTDGTNPDPSAMLEVKSSNRGLLLPRMNFAARPAAPATGLAIYQLDNGSGIYYYDGTAWQKISRASYEFWNPNGSDIFFTAGRVAIGTSNPNGNGMNVEHYVSGKGAVRGANQNNQTVFAEGYLGILYPGNIGIPGDPSINNIGVLGIKPNNGSNGAAVYGWNNDDNTANFAGLFFADGISGAGINYGVYAVAEKSGQNFAGYFRGRVSVVGNSGSAAGNDTTETPFISLVKHTRLVDTKAIEGISTPRPGYGIGVYGEGGWIGIKGSANAATYTGISYGIYGDATGSAGTRIGVYGQAYGGTTNWAGYFAGSTYIGGFLCIGTTTPATGYALSVNGKIACEEVLVMDMASWPDYVFKPGYKLLSLGNLEQSIRDQGHLPGLPSAKEVETNGLNLGEMQKQIVEKVEELTLYTIEQGKLLQEQGKMLREFKMEMDALKSENSSLKKLLENK